jgi:hypothetical protein
MGKREGACACETNNEREVGVKEVRDLVDEIRRSTHLRHRHNARERAATAYDGLTSR